MDFIEHFSTRLVLPRANKDIKHPHCARFEGWQLPLNLSFCVCEFTSIGYAEEWFEHSSFFASLKNNQDAPQVVYMSHSRKENYA